MSDMSEWVGETSEGAVRPPAGGENGGPDAETRRGLFRSFVKEGDFRKLARSAGLKESELRGILRNQYDIHLEAVLNTIDHRLVVLPKFRKRGFDPETVRQPRSYVNLGRVSNAITRFLSEGGQVELLGAERTRLLFEEIHWCVHQIRKRARIQAKSLEDVRRNMRQVLALVRKLRSAEEEICMANRRLVVSCAKSYFWVGPVWVEELLQEGMQALAHAIRRFDFTRGTPFYSYAQVSIQHRLHSYLQEQARDGNVPTGSKGDLATLKQAWDRWVEKHHSEPKAEDLVHDSGIPLAKVQKLLPYLAQWRDTPSPPVSLDALVGGEDVSLYHFVADESAPSAVRLTAHSEIREAIDKLPARLATVIRLRFFEGLTLEEVGNRFHLTRARIKQIQDDAIAKLREILLAPPASESGPM